MLDRYEEAKRWLTWAEQIRGISRSLKPQGKSRKRLTEFAEKLERMAVHVALHRADGATASTDDEALPAPNPCKKSRTFARR
jgi:hypothetical protein